MIELFIGEKIGKILHYSLKAAVALAFFIELANQNWLHAFTIAGIFLIIILPDLLKRRYKIYIPLELDFAVVLFVFFSLFLGDLYQFYEKFWWWDVYLHTNSGVLLGLLGFIMVYVINAREDIQTHMAPGFIALFAFSFALSLGALWEIMEYALDQTLGTKTQESGLPDTMADLIVDATGALFIATIGYFWMTRRISFYVFDHTISRFVRHNSHLFKPRTRRKIFRHLKTFIQNPRRRKREQHKN